MTRVGVLSFLLATQTLGQVQTVDPAANFRTDKLVAWCVVPFDAARRSPSQRARMLKDLGLTRCAYDWRARHVSEFEDEILAYKEHGIEFFAFWGSHPEAFRLFQKHGIRPQIWQTLSESGGKTQSEKVQAAVRRLGPLVKQTRELGCRLGLYNHGGWGGEPSNLVAVCRRLREGGDTHVGIVYNFHHGHGHIADWRRSLEEMKPYLLCLNLNGMNAQATPKILGLSKGSYELGMVRTVLASGYRGPIGVLDHRLELDARDSLQENRDGLRWILREITQPGSGGNRPADPRPATVRKGISRLLAGSDRYRRPPITIEVRGTFLLRNDYNIIVACDTKKSADHWELFTTPKDGFLTAYLPGRHPDHVRTTQTVCDGKPHTLAMVFEPNQVRLYVDGRPVVEQVTRPRSGQERFPGGLAIGRLVEGGLGCEGEIQWVRISRGVRKIPPLPRTTVTRDADTVGLWHFPYSESAPKRR